MATPIVVNPIKPSAVVVESNKKSGTPIKIDSSLDWERVEAIAADAARDAIKDMAIDTELSTLSENPVQNKVVTGKLNEMMNIIYAAL